MKTNQIKVYLKGIEMYINDASNKDFNRRYREDQQERASNLAQKVVELIG